jgi:hypothetical protein
MAALTAPQPEQPLPTEIANWSMGRDNARQQYMQNQAQSIYNKGQVGLSRDTALRQSTMLAGQQRHTFDDPYIGRGIFNSGIRRGGLVDWRNQQQMNEGNIQNQYLASMGQQLITDTGAQDAYDTYMRNSQLQEDARRTELAQQIKGII